ncbi:MAG TPA: amino acid permease [Vicinamibacteria bacterium]|nr:amino acid permease [Vicinamibacteria bacterium]
MADPQPAVAPRAMAADAREGPAAGPQLVRRLGAWDGALVTIGSVLGTGIFITTGDMARVLPHTGLILLAWVMGGLLTLCGALTIAELGAMYPRAGGQYQYLKEAYGPLWGFLFGWTCFFVIMSGGIATLAVGFGEYLGSFLPLFSTRHVLFTAPVGPWTWVVNGGQVAGALAIVFLTAINYVGLREGTLVQNAVTLAKIGSILALALLGLIVPAPVAEPFAAAPLPSGNVLAAFGVAMIAVFWTYDGWYGFAFLAGEVRRPERNIPLGLITGTLAITGLYLLVNLVYARAVPLEEMGQTSRIGETAAAALFGPTGARLVSLAVVVSTFGCISATVLYAARGYLPMAQDGLFFRSLSRIHPRYRTPTACLVAQGAWAVALTFTGTYEQLYTYVIFALFLFHALTGAAVIVLRRTRPDAPRPYRTWGYPVVPALFVLAASALLVNTLVEKPLESFLGLLLVGAGVPAYLWWRRRGATA